MAVGSPQTDLPLGAGGARELGGAEFLVDLDFFPTPAVTGSLKFWDGSVWATGTLKFWSGSAWGVGVLRRWDGAAWVVA